MKRSRMARAVVLVMLVFGGVGAAWAQSTPSVAEGLSREAELDSRRLVGRGYYENDKFAEAAAEFRRCGELAPGSAVDRFNLGMALMRGQKHAEALAALDEAQGIDPDLLASYYVRGIIHQREERYEQAIGDLRHVIEHDPACGGAHYNLGVCHKFMQDYEQAIAAFKRKVELTPSDPSSHYQLITLYRRIGQVDNAERHKEIYDRAKGTVEESEKTAEALERSKYSYIIASPRLARDLVPSVDGVRFRDVTQPARVVVPIATHVSNPQVQLGFGQTDYDAEAFAAHFVPSVGGAVTLGDYDGDGDLDLYVVNCAAEAEYSANRLFRNEGRGRFDDVTTAAGVGDTQMGIEAIFGDYDNDGHVDLYVVNYGPNVLYRNRGDGTFEDVSATSRANEPRFGQQALFVDYDHDNDLDIFVVNLATLAEAPNIRQFPPPGGFPGEANTLLRNNGDGTFSDYTDGAGLLVEMSQSRVAATADFDGDHDIDLFYGNRADPPRMFLNARMGRFAEGGTFAPRIRNAVRAVEVADFNHDGNLDLIMGVGAKLFLFANDGHGGFSGQTVGLPSTLAASGVTSIAVLDYNNDGWRDLLLSNGESLVLLGNMDNEYRDVTAAVGLEPFWGRIVDLETGDFEGDGDDDIVLQTADRGPVLLANFGRLGRHWLDVRLVGKKVNRSACGATVEIAAGGHYRKQVCDGGVIHFGLGELTGVDVVRVTWPNGVTQNVIRPDIDRSLTIEEYVKVSASCGFLYSFNGAGFELVNEILGIGPLGVPMAPDVYYPLDCTELTKIEAEQLVERDGAYELRLTEELREITYADQITLRVVDHPAEFEIIPNEMFTLPPFPEDKFFAVGARRVPVSAVDERGCDVRDLIAERDGRVPTFPLTKFHGLAEPHWLELDCGDLSGAERIMLFLDSWIYWADSNISIALAQDPRHGFSPLVLEVPDAAGEWRTVIDWVGLPTSKGLVVPVDLSGKFLCDDYRVRLRTNLCVYFDRIFLATSDEAARCRQAELPVASADLHYRGFSRMKQDALGFERFDYDAVSLTGSWSPPAGMFTRYGDVTPLLGAVDDMYVIFGPGDELTMRFDARQLPELPAGWRRDFIFYANGWVKDGELNTKFSETVTPLPFHGMSGYPYAADEHYPDTPAHREYLRTYNTRPAWSTVGRLARPG